MVSCCRELLAILVVALLLIGPAAARELTPRDARLEVVLDDPAAVPLVKEMVLATLRGTYDARLPITLEEVEIPRMGDFEWVQLDRDAWKEERIDGRQLRIMERRIAFFPQRAGNITIRPIVQHLTVDDGGHWEEHDVASPPVTVKVEPALAAAGEWWLPAKMIEMSDKWDKEPDKLAKGATVVRRVTLWALGVTPGMLPPQPPMREPWLITFAAPDERTTELTWGGPISTVTWEWTFQPITGESGVIPPVEIPFYDTLEREPHTILLQAAPIAFEGVTDNTADRWREGFGGTWMLVLAALLGALAVVFTLAPGLRLRTRAEVGRRIRALRPDGTALALGRAARRGDVAAFRAAALALLDRRGIVEETERHALLEPLDRSLFGASAAAPSDIRRDLAALARRLRTAQPAMRRPAAP